jgi:hypothetical protein
MVLLQLWGWAYDVHDGCSMYNVWALALWELQLPLGSMVEALSMIDRSWI